MTVSYFVSIAERRIEVTFGTQALRADRGRALEAVLELLREHAGFGVMIDACAPMRPLSGDEARSLTETVTAHAPLFRGGIALLTEPGRTYGTPRLQQAKTVLHEIELAVFTQRDAATWWLASRVEQGVRDRAGR